MSLPLSIEEYSDKDFIALVKEWEQLNEYDRIALIVSRSNNLEGLLTPITRTIKKNVYSFGNSPDHWHDAEKIINACISILSDNYSESFQRDLDQRLETATIKSDLLEEEQAIIAKKISVEPLLSGYIAAKTNRPAFVPMLRHLEFNSDVINSNKIKAIAFGVAYYRLENSCRKLLANETESNFKYKKREPIPAKVELTDKEKRFESIFTPGKLGLIKDLMKHLGITNENGTTNPELTKENNRKAAPLMAIIGIIQLDSIKEDSSNFLRNAITQNKLVEEFNAYLGTTYKSFKGDSKGFHTQKSRAEKFIQSEKHNHPITAL